MLQEVPTEVLDSGKVGRKYYKLTVADVRSEFDFRLILSRVQSLIKLSAFRYAQLTRIDLTMITKGGEREEY